MSDARLMEVRQIAEQGWLGMWWPAEYGGQERSGNYDIKLTEALSRFGAPQPRAWHSRRRFRQRRLG